MRLTPKQAGALMRLEAGESIARSTLSRPLLRALQDRNAVRLERSGASYVVRGIPGRIAAFVTRECGIHDLPGFAALDPETRTRADLARIAGDTKALTAHPLDGIFLRLTDAADLRGKPLNPTAEGCAHFIAASELPSLSIRAPLLMGVENAEAFLNFESCLGHFSNMDFSHVALIWRWSWGGRWQKWLRQYRGSFIWFPDYDPAGLVIYSSQILSCRPDAHLLIPDSFDKLLEERGSRNLFLRQENMLSSLPAHGEVQAVATRIKRARKALEHETLIVSQRWSNAHDQDDHPEGRSSVSAHSLGD